MAMRRHGNRLGEIMCHFVTMVAPEGVDEGALKSMLKQHQRGFTPIENRFVQGCLKQGELYFLPTPKHCDCGTMLGASRRLQMGTERDDVQLGNELAKRRRKGWSEAKIGRWLEDARKTKEKGLKLDSAVGPETWPELLEAALKELKLPYIGILLHMYSGGLEAEPKVVARKKFRLGDDLRRRLYEMKEDVLYIVEAA